MEITLTPSDTTVVYTAIYKEPILEITAENPRFEFVKKLLKMFDLRLNDLRFDLQLLSDKYVSFNQLYGNSFLEVSFGLEQLSASLKRPLSGDQIREHFGNLASLIDYNKVSSQMFSIRQQCSADQKTKEYFSELTPYVPEALKEGVKRTGIIYDWESKDHGLIVNIVISPSLFLDDGIYLSIEGEFIENKYSFKEANAIAEDKFNYITKAFNLKFEENK